MALESGQMKLLQAAPITLMPNRDCESSAAYKIFRPLIAFKRHFIQTDVNDVLDQKKLIPFIPTRNNKQINKYQNRSGNAEERFFLIPPCLTY
jgi:hypothetical protein